MINQNDIKLNRLIKGSYENNFLSMKHPFRRRAIKL